MTKKAVIKLGHRKYKVNLLRFAVSAIIISAALALPVYGITEAVKAMQPATLTAYAADVQEIEEKECISSEEPAVLPEEEPAVIEAPEEPAMPELDEAEVEMLACVIYQEAGGNECSDLCRKYVGDVVLNRVNDNRFPDTLEGVLTQKSQYGRFHWTGIIWPKRASNAGEAAAVQRAYDTARALLSGNHSELFGEGYIFQAEFKQGKDIIFLDGMYFGR